MIKEIEVETFLESMNLGISRPALITGDDYKDYILKSQRVDENGKIKDYNCMFLNEMLAYQIGKYLDVPMPDAAIAHISKDFLTEDTKIRFAYRFEEGNYFASEKLAELENNLEENMNELRKMGKNYSSRTWKNFFKNIDNKDKIANILSFDIMIANFDRYSNQGNILISGENGRNIFAIDHGHAFGGPTLTKEQLNMMGYGIKQVGYCDAFVLAIKQESGRIFRALADHIDLKDLSKNPFNQVVQKIENITEELIEEWLNSIPIEWYIDKKLQFEYYKNFLIAQKNLVKIIIETMAKYELFDNYLGGALIWKKEEASSTVS